MDDDNCPIAHRSRTWTWEVQIDGTLVKSGTFQSSPDTVSLTLCGVHRVRNWRRYGHQRDADGVIKAYRLVAQMNRQIIVASCYRQEA